jgi:hypothetical protein
MKKVLGLMIFLIVITNVFAQKNFEGEIIYKNVSKFDTSKNGIIKVFFKGNKMLISNEIKKNDLTIYTLYDFEKRHSYISIPSDSDVMRTEIMESPLIKLKDTISNSENILGYNCIKSTFKAPIYSKDYISDINAFFSDKLKFKIPFDNKFITPLAFVFFNNNISLGIKFKAINMRDLNLKNVEIEYKVISIEEKILDKTLFEIPCY